MTGEDQSAVVFAPARVDLSAGFTDVKPFCDELPGRVVNLALSLGVKVRVRDKTSPRPTVSFVDRLAEAVARRLMVPRPVIEISASGLPAGGGLGGSGALSVALAYAISLSAGSSTEPSEIVKLACLAESDTGLTGGTQDQLASVYGGAGLVRRHLDLGSRIHLNADLNALGDRLLLVHGRGRHDSGSIIEHVLYRRPRAIVMRTIKAMNEVAELLASQLELGDFEQVAELINESTALLRDLHEGIVGDVDRWFRSLGASAAKPCGAGGPGAVWALLTDPPLRPALIADVQKAGWTSLAAAPRSEGATAGHSPIQCHNRTNGQ